MVKGAHRPDFAGHFPQMSHQFLGLIAENDVHNMNESPSSPFHCNTLQQPLKHTLQRTLQHCNTV